MTNKTPALLKFLEQKGICLQNLIDCALEMYVPHPGIETQEKATEMLMEEFLDVLNDVNISILETAAFHAQEDAEKGLIPGLTQERFRGRPGPVADEILGIAIATYIAGTRGVFEYVRFDQAKPGILKKLGSITNDAIGALVAGVSANVYTRATRNAETDQVSRDDAVFYQSK
jgi:alpha-ribazole phosphatase CobZ